MSNNHPSVGDRYRATERIKSLGFRLPSDGLCVGDIVRITEDDGVRVSIERESQGVARMRNGHGIHFSHFADPGAGRAFELVERAAPQVETSAADDCANNERFALRGDQPEDMAKWAAKAPDGATHVAIDYNGEVWAYYAKPVAIESQKLWAYARENQYGGSGTQAKTAQLLGNVARGFQGWQYTLYETGAARLVPAGESRKEALDTISDAYVQALEARVEEQKATIALLEGVNAAQAASISALRADAKRDAKLTAERYDRLRELLGIPMGLPVEQAVQNMLAQNHSLIEQLRQRTAERDAAHQTLLSRKVIELSRAEVQFGLDRVRWAAGLIRQLPVTHDGRNSWLMHYGNEAERARCFTAALTKPEADADEMAGMPVAQPTEAQVEAKRALEAVERPMYRTIKLNGRPVRVVAPIWF